MSGQDSLAISKAFPLAISITVTTTPVALPNFDTGHGLTEIILRAAAGNTDDILIGNAAAQVLPLHPDEDIEIAIANPASISVVAQSGSQVLNVIGRD